MLSAVGHREDLREREQQRSGERERQKDGPGAARGQREQAARLFAPRRAERTQKRERARESSRQKRDRRLSGQKLQAQREPGGRGGARGLRGAARPLDREDRGRAPGEPRRRGDRIHERRAVGQHHSREGESDPREKRRILAEAQGAPEAARAEERPENVQEVMQVEGRGRRQDALQQKRRVEQHGVGIGEQRLPSGRRGVDERHFSGGERRRRDAPPRPVRDLGVAEDEPLRAHDLGQQRQREEEGDGEARKERASRGH